MAKLPYKAAIATAQQFAAAPKGKVPFIDYQEKIVGDSTLIIEMLNAYIVIFSIITRISAAGFSAERNCRSILRKLDLVLRVSCQ